MNRIVLLLLAWPVTALADMDWLIASATESVMSGQPFRLVVVRPASSADWPATLPLRAIDAEGREVALQLHAQDGDLSNDSRRTYAGEMRGFAPGMVRVELDGMNSNRLALVVTDHGADNVAPPISLSAQQAQVEVGDEATRDIPIEELKLPALSVSEPMYFILGTEGTARFQLSFKYRLFAPDGPVVSMLPALGGMYFGYTQNSFWDLGSTSRPFHDTSYRPSLFWQGAGSGDGLWPAAWRGGYEHESNGKDALDSRSIDTLFFEPTWRHSFSGGNTLSFSPKFYAYVDKSDNPDIQRYRGFADWGVRFGKNDGWVMTARYRQGTAGYISGQIDASYPLVTQLFANIGSFLHVQYFSGYGENLLDYNRRQDNQFRIGISIVR